MLRVTKTSMVNMAQVLWVEIVGQRVSFVMGNDGDVGEVGVSTTFDKLHPDALAWLERHNLIMQVTGGGYVVAP